MSSDMCADTTTGLPSPSSKASQLSKYHMQPKTQHENQHQTLSRKAFARERRRLSPRQRQQQARLASRHLQALTAPIIGLSKSWLSPPSGKKTVRIGIYYDGFGELPTQPIVDWAMRLGFEVCLPVVGTLGAQDKRLRFAPITRHQLIATQTLTHRLGMQQPVSRKLYWADELTVIFCPLIAVDRLGYRMGMGGGYYDTTLAKIEQGRLPTPLRVGWCYDFQLVERLQHQPWDVPMDVVVTPKQMRWF